MNTNNNNHDMTERKIVPELIPQVIEVLSEHNFKIVNIDTEGFEIGFTPPHHNLQYTMSFKFNECQTIEDFSDRINNIRGNFDKEKVSMEMINKRNEKGLIENNYYSVERIVNYTDAVYCKLMDLTVDIGYDLEHIKETMLTIPAYLDITLEQRGFKAVLDSIEKNPNGGVDIHLVDDTAQEIYSDYVRTFSDDIYYIAQLGYNPNLIAEFDSAEATPKTFKELLDTKGYEDTGLEIIVRINNQNDVQMFCELYSDGLHENSFVGANIQLTENEQSAIYNSIEKQLGKSKLNNLIGKNTKEKSD